jgi:hypothetical protein
MVLAIPEPQSLFGVTETFPLLAPAIAVMEAVVDVPVQPEGRVHVYEVAPPTAVTLKVWEEPWHTVVLPVITPG